MTGTASYVPRLAHGAPSRSHLRSRVMKTLLVLVALLALVACQKGPAEKAGRSIDNAADKAGRAIEKAGEKVRDAAK